jgi:hypothetical protein
MTCTKSVIIKLLDTTRKKREEGRRIFELLSRARSRPEVKEEVFSKEELLQTRQKE